MTRLGADLCSTAFGAELLAKWSEHAADSLRPGSRVLTLSMPLTHEAFRLEAMHTDPTGGS